MVRNNSGYVLSTGRVIEANQGLLCPMDDGVLAEGYDGTVDSWLAAPLTAEERKEIAEHMISVWQAWALA